MKKTCNTRQHQINRIILIINIFKRQLYCYSRNNLIKHYIILYQNIKIFLYLKRFQIKYQM